MTKDVRRCIGAREGVGKGRERHVGAGLRASGAIGHVQAPLTPGFLEYT